MGDDAAEKPAPEQPGSDKPGADRASLHDRAMKASSGWNTDSSYRRVPTAADQPKQSLKGRFSKWVDRFIRKFNTDKFWYDE